MEYYNNRLRNDSKRFFSTNRIVVALPQAVFRLGEFFGYLRVAVGEAGVSVTVVLDDGNFLVLVGRLVACFILLLLLLLLLHLLLLIMYILLRNVVIVGGVVIVLFVVVVARGIWFLSRRNV